MPDSGQVRGLGAARSAVSTIAPPVSRIGLPVPFIRSKNLIDLWPHLNRIPSADVTVSCEPAGCLVTFLTMEIRKTM